MIMQVPRKLNHGENFKTSVVYTVNSIIDYLKTQKVVGDNKYISVSETPTGYIVKGIKQGETSNGKGGGNQIIRVEPVIFSISSGDNKSGYTGGYYKDGGYIRTEQMFFPMLNLSYIVPDGSYLGFLVDADAVGGND